jgi:uncharacterized membrane protein YbhN (UPF0104 family)
MPQEGMYFLTLVSHFKKIVPALHGGGTVSHVIRVILTVLFIVIVNRSLTFHEVHSMLGSIDTSDITLCILISVVSTLLLALRWWIVMRSYNLECSFMTALKTLLWGNVLAFITPGRAGELFRGLESHPSQKISSILAAGTDRVFSIGTVIIFAIPAMFVQWFYWHTASPLYFTILFSIGTLCLTGCCVVFLFPRSIQHLSIVRSLQGALIFDAVKKVDIVSVTLLSAGIHCLLILQTTFLFGLFGMDNWFENCTIAVLSYAFMLCVPVSIANIGIREYAFALFAGKVYSGTSLSFSISTAAFGVSGTILFINIILPALAGLLWNFVPVRGVKQKDIAVSE